MGNLKLKLACCRFLRLKNLGLAALTFSAGVISGLFLPVYFIAVIETLMIIFLGYLCLFVWN